MSDFPGDAKRLAVIVGADARRMAILNILSRVGGKRFWIGAGFLRAAVWDHLHDRAPSPPDGDVDVICFDPESADAATDRQIEDQLFAVDAGLKWSVKNQARMHVRNGDAPYTSLADAIARWPETATTIAARVVNARLEIVAPHGFDDLFSLVLRPTPAFSGAKYSVFMERVRGKHWLERWPMLRVAAAA